MVFIYFVKSSLYRNYFREKMIKKHSIGTQFLGKYTNKKKLGKGAFGDVYLVEDKKGQLFALKMIQKKKLEGDNQDMIEYLEGEVKCMKDVKQENMVKLYEFDSDEEYYYMVLEYCDGGDLVNQQATLPNKVFPLKTTAQYLSQVIKGLEQLHKKGYLHRDIKPQNVILKNQNGVKVLKLADFGFAKKATNLQGTVLGTEQYMSPQIYRCGAEGVEMEAEGQIYGYEVDMWAFGVLFFYMLNQAFPFEINPYWSLDEKYKELENQAQNFSYRKAVMKTRRKIEENCTQDLQDLFKKIFNVFIDKRITFSEIRQHKVFKPYFPSASQESQILYRLKFVSSRLKKGKGGVKNNLQQKLKKLKGNSTLNKSSSEISGSEPAQEEYNAEKEIIRLELQEMDFLLKMADGFCSLQTIDRTKTAMVAYNLVKYNIILLKKFLKTFNSKSYREKHHKRQGLVWQNLFNDQKFKENIKKQCATKLKKALVQFENLFNLCENKLKEIRTINSYFEDSFSQEVEEDDEFDDNFNLSYRQSTNMLYSAIKQELKTNKAKELYFHLCVACICHVFNDFYNHPDQKQKIFDVYLNQQNEKSSYFSYNRFVDYLRGSTKEVIVKQASKVIQECMGAK